MKVQGVVGIKELSNGSESDLRLNSTGALITAAGFPAYEQMVLDGNVYIGANLGGTPVTTQVGLSATTPALTLYNPIGSGVNLVLITTTVNITASPAAAAGLMLAYNFASAAAPSATTLANVTNAKIGTAKQPIGQCYRICTLAAAPIYTRSMGGPIGAASTSGVVLRDNIDGEIVLSPGVAISVQSTSAAAIIATFTWKEQPI